MDEKDERAKREAAKDIATESFQSDCRSYEGCNGAVSFREGFDAGYAAARASSPAACVHEWELGDMTKTHDCYFWYCVKCKAVEETPDVNPPKGASSPAVPSEAVEVVNDILTNTLSHAEREDSTDDLRRKCRRNAEALRTLLDHVSRPTWVRVEDGLPREACCHESLESRIGDFVSDCGMPADMDELIGMFQQFCREEGFDEYKTS